METLSYDSLFEIARHLNYDALAHLCQSNKQLLTACKEDSLFQKLLANRKLEQQLLNRLVAGTSFTYTLAGGWGSLKQHFLKFISFIYSNEYAIRETITGYSDRVSILQRLPYGHQPMSSLFKQKTTSTRPLTLEEVRLVSRLLIESPRFNPNNLEYVSDN